ncbi:DUF4179 domain-containing protein [Fredinandcohnia sp. FSL W7-1320]|uniref:DUF4179 domain-containing protein n=1 Tax=Fredinandcohnia sp. FSL W7-1320 TaxID=2954540 RepID=UPI0030FD716B
MDKWEEQIRLKANPQLPVSVEHRMNETLRSLPKKKTYPRFYYSAAAIFIVGFLLFGISFMSPTLAETMRSVPVIGSIFKMVGDIGTEKGEEEGLTTLLGQQVEVNGQVITFTESLYDGSQIHIGYLIESYTQVDHKQSTDFLSDLWLTIDGKGVSYGMGGRGEELKNGDYAGVISIKIREELPENFTLGIKSKKEKSLDVELPIKKQGTNQAFLVNELLETQDLTIQVDKVTFFPTSTEIAMRQIMDEKTYNNNKYEWMDYQVIDDQGRVLQPLSGGGSGGLSKGKFVQTLKQYFEPLENIPKSLTIKPYLWDVTEEKAEEVRTKWEGKQLVLPQGEIGETSVLDIKSEDGIVTLTVETTGDNGYFQSNSIWIEDTNGNAYYSENAPKRVEGTTNQYLIQCEANLAVEDIKVVTYKQKAPNYLEELEVTIEFEG